MPESREDYRDRSRHRSPAGSPHAKSERRRKYDDEYESSSRRRDDRRSSRRDGSRRRSSRSPSGRSSRKRDDDHRRRERRERADNSDDDRRRRRHRSPPSSRDPVRSRGALPSQQDAYTSEVAQKDPSAPPPEKEKPNFANTGRLAAESNTVNVSGGGTVVLKYHEPPEARKPPAKDPWRLYVFKGDDLLEVVELNERSCWLIGRENLVVDFPLEHPSCSKQHAALQFRYVEKRNEFGDRIGRVRPYLIDLESANGSAVNGDKIPGGRYVEVRDKDVLKFGLSTREYVLMLARTE
ncbi:hypothetical protein RU639_000302 [Aspergillus parasiticus]